MPQGAEKRGMVRCPRHNKTFDLATGESPGNCEILQTSLGILKTWDFYVRKSTKRWLGIIVRKTYPSIHSLWKRNCHKWWFLLQNRCNHSANHELFDMPQVWFHIFWALLPNSETCEDWSLGNIRTKISLIGHKSFISHQNYQNNNRIYDICRDSQSLICVFKTYLYKMKLLKSNISGLWFLSHHSGGFDLSHEVSISISWWSLLCSSGRRERCERCECGTGLRSIKLDGLGWTTSGIAWCHMSSWSWIMIQTHVVSCLGDPALGVAICNLPNGEAVVVVGNPPRPPQLLQRHTKFIGNSWSLNFCWNFCWPSKLS